MFFPKLVYPRDKKGNKQQKHAQICQGSRSKYPKVQTNSCTRCSTFKSAAGDANVLAVPTPARAKERRSDETPFGLINKPCLQFPPRILTYFHSSIGVTIPLVPTETKLYVVFWTPLSRKWAIDQLVSRPHQSIYNLTYQTHQATEPTFTRQQIFPDNSNMCGPKGATNGHVSTSFTTRHWIV